MRPEVLAHLMENVFPNYYLNDEGHGLSHIAYVLRRSILEIGNLLFNEKSRID